MILLPRVLLSPVGVVLGHWECDLGGREIPVLPSTEVRQEWRHHILLLLISEIANV